uniref:PNPLA domain-containing protein n=1 Tax=Ditylenchus dipsaci TaxID=166011 RepID=A0A915CNU4_9BILA
MNLSFAGCGFLCIYHAGVCAAIKEYCSQLTRNKISGASAGSVAAAGLICNVVLSEATSIILQVVCKWRIRHLPTDLDSASFLASTFTEHPFNLLPKICFGFEDTLKFLTKNAMTPCARCLTIQSNALPLPHHKNIRPNTLAIKSATNKIRADECGRCFERMENGSEPQFTNIPLPKVVQQTLDDAAAAEGRLFKYLRSFRAFRWTMRFMTPIILPCEITLFVIRTLRSWLSKYSTTDFYLLKLQTMVDFVLNEIDSKRLLYEPTRVSCQFAITNLEDAAVSKYQSRLELNEAGTPLESNLLSASHRSLSRLASASVLNIPAEEIEVSGRHIPTPMCALPAALPVEDEDTVAQLQEYSLNHDAVLAFYYKDEETNQVKIDEDDENKAKTCPPDLKLNEEQGMELEDDENQFPLEDLAESVEKMQEREAAEDSGLSLTEDSSHAKDTKKRDACCSPVRSSDMDPKTKWIHPVHPTKTPTPSISSSRRNTMTGSRKSLRSNKSIGSTGTAASAGRKSSISSSKIPVAIHNNANSSTSSDCEDNDNENLFVPAKSSNLVQRKNKDGNATSSLPISSKKSGGLGKLLTGLASHAAQPNIRKSSHKYL